ncbi:MAG: hypothetical protein ACM3WV_05970 [Bacillota bacterium]
MFSSAAGKFSARWISLPGRGLDPGGVERAAAWSRISAPYSRKLEKRSYRAPRWAVLRSLFCGTVRRESDNAAYAISDICGMGTDRIFHKPHYRTRLAPLPAEVVNVSQFSPSVPQGTP